MSLRLVKVENNTTKEGMLLRKLYTGYAKEMSKYSMSPIEPDVKFAPGYHHRIIFADNISVGFMIHSSYPLSLSRADLQIRALYVMPYYRRQGIGESAVIQLLWDKHVDGDVSIVLSERNQNAMLFWESVFSSLGYVERTSALNMRAADKEQFDTVLLYYVKGS